MPNNVPLYSYTAFCLSTYQLMGTGAVSTFLLIWIMLLWTFMYKFLCELVSSFIPGIYIGVELLNHIAILLLQFYSSLWGAAKHFSKAAASFYIPTSSAQGFQFLCILANQHLLSVFLITDIWVDVKWHLIVVILRFLDE